MLLLDDGEGIAVLDPASSIALWRPASCFPWPIGGAGLTGRRYHGPTGVEHLELPTVVMAQLVGVLLLNVRLAWVGCTCRALILHRSEDYLIHQRLLGYLLSPFVHDLTLRAGSRCLRSRRPQWLIHGVLINLGWFLLVTIMLFRIVSPVYCLHGRSHLASMPLFESESTNFAVLLGHLDGTVRVLQLVPGCNLSWRSKLLVGFSSFACTGRLIGERPTSIHMVNPVDEWRLVDLQLRGVGRHALLLHAYSHLVVPL